MREMPRNKRTRPNWEKSGMQLVSRHRQPAIFWKICGMLLLFGGGLTMDGWMDGGRSRPYVHSP